MTILQDIAVALGWQIRVNENFAAVSPAALFSKRAASTSGLTLGYHGGILDGVSYNNGTIALAASSTRYVVVKRSDGVVSSATGTTNWNNQTDYLRMGIASTDGVSITSWQDWRESYKAGGGGGGGTGDVVGPASAVADRVVTFDGTTGKLIKDGGTLLSDLAPKASPALTGTATAVNVTFSGLALTAASASGGAGLRLPHGAAPTTPTNGDVWTTTVGLYARINGSTVGPFAVAGGSPSWGSITGTLSSQTDLQAALDAKQARAPSIQSVTSASTVTPTFSNDQVEVTALAANVTLANPTGTAIPGLAISIRIKDNGTARTIGYGSQYRALGVTLPTTTVLGKTMYLAMIYNSADTKWDVVAVAQEA